MYNKNIYLEKPSMIPKNTNIFIIINVTVNDDYDDNSNYKSLKININNSNN